MTQAVATRIPAIAEHMRHATGLEPGPQRRKPLGAVSVMVW